MIQMQFIIDGNYHENDLFLSDYKVYMSNFLVPRRLCLWKFLKKINLYF